MTGADIEQTLATSAALHIEGDHLKAENARLRAQVDTLEAALTSRIVIEQAVGIMAEKRHVTIPVAFDLLRDHARRHHQTIHDISAAIVAHQERMAS